ncbi:MAG TPA: DUF1028 domain-containing protein [Microbacteriaceae bacterium]
MTFSLLAMDKKRRFMVAASATKTLSVGASVIALRPRVGGVLSQALTNSELRGLGLDNLSKGSSPTDAISETLSKDNDMETRQLAIMDIAGNSATHTGVDCLAHAADSAENGYAIIGNLLSDPNVVTSMAGGFQDVEGAQNLAKMALQMMRAGELAGGDSRGLQSAALIVRDMTLGNEYSAAEVDIRVDDHTDPLAELDRILKLALQEKAVKVVN